ncbi:MAG TPA: hypothetical protein PKL83_00400 [bacterium]|nr:hypothetical protein [bacterium]
MLPVYKKICAIVLLFAIILPSIPAVYAYEWTCSDAGVSVPADQRNQSLACGDMFDSCSQYNNQRTQVYNSCISAGGGCWDIGRAAWLEGPDNCPADYETSFNPDDFQYEGNLRYCQCVEACEAKKLEPVDCNSYFRKCCNLILEADYDDYGFLDDPELDFRDDVEEEKTAEIVVSTGAFELEANGKSTHEIAAHVEDADGKTIQVPMSVALKRPNTIRAGTLKVSKGNEGGSDTSVQATYTAPQINVSEKTEAADQIIDLIYVFATIDGKQVYKVITAKLATQGENVRLTVKKAGFQTEELSIAFNKGSLTGTVWIKNLQGEQVPVHDAEITLIDPNSFGTEQTTRTSDLGNFVYEQPDRTGEDDLSIELELDADSNKHYDKGVRYAEALDDLFASSAARDYIDNYHATLAGATAAEIPQVLEGLKLASYTLYFVEYYNRKAEESLQNFSDYSRNMFKDTASFIAGVYSVVDGLYNAAGGLDGEKTKTMGSLMFKFMQYKGDEGPMTAFAKAILVMTTEGIRSLSNNPSYAFYIKELQVLFGGLENDLVNRSLDWLDAAALEKAISGYFEDRIRQYYQEKIHTLLAGYRIDRNQLPPDLDARINHAEEMFKSNTERHDDRNAIQYEWDVDTAFATLLVDIGKGTAKAILILKSGSFDATRMKAIDDAIDLIGNGYNLLKAAASANHTYEWLVLYLQDMEDMERSLSYLYTGRETVSLFTRDEHTEQNDSGTFAWLGSAHADEAVQAMDMTTLLYNTTEALRNEDEEALESAMTDYRIVYASEYDALENRRADVLDQGMGNQSLAAESSELASAFADNQFQLALLDAKLFALALDPSTERIDTFMETVNSYDAAKNQTDKAYTDFMIRVDAEKEKIADKTDSQDPALALGLAGATVLLALIGMALVPKLGKKNKKTALLAALLILALCGTAGISAYILFTSDDEREKTETSEPSVSPAPTPETNTDPDNEASDDDLDTDTPDNSEENPEKIKDSEPITYTNDSYGFSLTLPAAWEDYEVTVETSGRGGEAYLNFSLPTTDENYGSEVTIFTVTVYETNDDLEISPFEEMLNADSVYTYTWSHLNGDPPADLQDAILDLEEIRASFTLTDPQGPVG